MTANDKDPRAEEAVRRWDELKALRAPHEQDWEDLARLIRPQRGGFTTANPALARTDKPLSSEPIIAQSNFAAGLYGTLTNPASKWMGLELTDLDLMKWQPAREWLDMASARVLNSFRPDVSSFYDSSIQLFADLATFGNAAAYDEVDTQEQRILDVTLSLAQIVVAIDGWGRVVEVVRKFTLTPRQAVRMFGVANLPPKIVERAEKGQQETADYFHHVLPNVDWRKGMLGPRGKRWLSRYATEGQVIRESGYADMPFYFPRWEVDTGQCYGRGPGMTALPSSRALNFLEDANMRAGQRAADPTLLAPDQDAWALNGVIRPGSVVYGGVNARGEPLVRPLDVSGGTGLTLEMAQAKVEAIRDAFHWSLMSIAGRTGMTATEVLEITEQQQRLMAPHLGRVQGEFLAPKIGRRFGLLFAQGQIPPPPSEMAREGVGLSVTYLSAAAMAQRSAEGAALGRLLADISPLAEFKPRMMDRIDDDALFEALHLARGAPASIMRSREAADALSEARAQQEQAAQALQAAQVGGGVVRDLASAQGRAA